MPTNAINDTGVKYLYDKLHGEIEPIAEAVSDSEVTIEGNPLSFNTLSSQNAKSTILSLEPIQDLHGYDKPWVGGAGKNLWDEQWESGSISGNTGLPFPDANYIRSKNFTNISDAITYYHFAINGKVAFALYYDDNEDYIGTSAQTVYANTSFTPNVTGAKKVKFVFTQGTYDSTNKRAIMLNSETEKTYAPYENICPITGRTEIGISGCGRNRYQMRDSNASINGINVVANSDGTVNISGTASGGSASIGLCKNVSELANLLAEGGNYTLSLNKGTYSSTTLNVSVAYKKPNDSGTYFLIPGHTDVIPANSTFISSNLYVDNGNSVQALNNFAIQLEKTSPATTYEPYTKSNDLTISFGQTVYGGTLDVENGVLVVDRGYAVFDGSNDENWAKANDKMLQTSILTDIYVESNSQKPNIVNNLFEVVSNNDLFDNPIYGMSASTDKYLRLRSANITWTLEEWTTFLSTNNLQVCYELATPITINLTPNTINLLKGVNNISTDGDKITLTYRNGKFATLDGAVPKMTFRGEDYTMGIDDIGLFLKNLTKSTKTYIADPLLNFDGTVATYKKIMKQWFINNGVNVMDSTGITYLCERWYEITKQGWKGGTSFPAVGVSTGSTGTRFDDNVDMSVTPSTDTSANTDTYQGLPLFAITDCNWELDSDGNILITAIDGITDNFVRDDPTKFVGVMQQTGWVKKVDDASTQKYYYADDKNAYPDLVPLPEAIKLDGTVRSFVVHAKYMSGIVDSKMTCCSGVIPRRNISHDSLVTLPDNIGTQYSGGTSVDWSFLVWMQRIKYASLTSDGVLQGCCNYNYQYYVKVSETGVKRLILSSANGANLKVGSTVTFGAYAGNADRGQASTYSISGQDGAIITSIEDVTIDGTTYKAVYVDTTSTFDTVANGDATNGTTIVSTHHWISGTCDTVKGNDGSPVSATNGVYSAKLQGIEFMVGGYEVMADVIMNISGGYYNPYYARKSTDQATSITSSMVQSTLKCAQPSSDAWRYIQKYGFDGEIFYPVLTGTSSSEYMKDGFYENGTSTSTGTREWLGFGYLYNGSGVAGLSCISGHFGLGVGWWGYIARLSCNGNRGILLTA